MVRLVRSAGPREGAADKERVAASLAASQEELDAWHKMELEAYSKEKFSMDEFLEEDELEEDEFDFASFEPIRDESDWGPDEDRDKPVVAKGRVGEPAKGAWGRWFGVEKKKEPAAPSPKRRSGTGSGGPG